MNKYLPYTGIGSRSTPPETLKTMREIAKFLAKKGFTLRSGAADGADKSFEEGCDEVGGKKEIFLPWKGFNDSKSDLFLWPQGAWKIAEGIHPAWEKCDYNSKLFHSRNICQLLGYELDSESLFVVCWTPEGKEVGGTATVLKLARERGILVFNLGSKTGLTKLRKWCKKL
jgi:hypothetical protein